MCRSFNLHQIFNFDFRSFDDDPQVYSQWNIFYFQKYAYKFKLEFQETRFPGGISVNLAISVVFSTTKEWLAGCWSCSSSRYAVSGVIRINHVFLTINDHLTWRKKELIKTNKFVKKFTSKTPLEKWLISISP